MKYSILMPYMTRPEQLYNTLVSYKYHYSHRNDYEIIIGEDIKNNENKQDHAELIKVISQFTNFNIRWIKTEFRHTTNPSCIYNECARRANGHFLILTSPEIFHVTNILKGFDDIFDINTNSYIVAGCESGSNFVLEDNTFALDTKYDHHMWYQHSIHRNLMYHFCTAILRQNYMTIGGFDEQFSNGISYDDDDFVMSVRKIDLDILIRDDLRTVHQKHDRLSISTPGYMDRLHKNEDLYKSKWGVK